MTEKATCTLCAKVESSGFYTGCMIQDGACTDSGWQCDGNGNLTRPDDDCSCGGGDLSGHDVMCPYALSSRDRA